MVRLIMIVFISGLLCSACGKVSRPVSPEGATYPAVYVVQDDF